MGTITTVGEKNNKKVINSWALFDWANSAYSLVISTAIFPVYFISSTPEQIDLFGISFSNAALYSFAVSFSYIIIAALSPLLSGIADYSGKRMFFMRVFTLIGALSCSLLYFFKGEPQLWLGTSAFILATIGFAGSLVFYDSYLPLIVTEDRYDRVSAKGYAYGYVGSVLLLLFILFMLQKPSYFGFEDEGTPARIGFLLVGLWWIFWSQFAFRNLPKDAKARINFDKIKQGYNEIKKVSLHAIKNANVVNFLVAVFLINAGVQTVVYLATTFAEKILKLEKAELILVVLIIQLIAIVGSYFFAWVSKRIGNINSIIIQTLIWMLVCFIAYVTKTKTVFYITAGLVGMVLGGIQSLCRATYSKILQQFENKETDVTSYFSLLDILNKISLAGGTFLFGLVYQLTGNMRYSVLVLSLLFFGALFFVRKVKLIHEKVEDLSK